MAYYNQKQLFNKIVINGVTRYCKIAYKGVAAVVKPQLVVTDGVLNFANSTVTDGVLYEENITVVDNVLTVD